MLAHGGSVTRAPSDLPSPPAEPSPRRDGWGASLTICGTSALAFLTFSGLAIWLAPFGAFAQITVLLHTLAGLAVSVPVAWYCWRHWRSYRSRPLTHVKLVGYVALGVLAVCAVSGFVLTWQ